MERFCSPGAVLWDIGAFVGHISAHFAHPRFQLAAIHAFEPNPANLARLKAMFGNSARVAIHPFALGQTETTMTLSFGARDASVGSLVRECKGGERVSVLVRHGDTVRRELKIPAPDVIKIDVEGFELEVVRGLSDTISEKRPVIFFEHVFLSDGQLEQMIPKGYQMFFINDDGDIAEGLSSRNKGHDAFIVPSEKVSAAESLMPAKR
jgi:FkbM family methyltransferase